MYQTSATYNPYAPSRHVQIETQLRIVDESAAGNATVTADNADSCSSVSTLAADELTSMGGAFVTLEPDYLACNRTWDIMPDDYHAGYWADSIGDSQKVSFTFSSPVTSMGLSLWFDMDAGVWPIYVSVQFHNTATTDTDTDTDSDSDAEDTPDAEPIDVSPERGFAVLMFPVAEPVTYSGLTLTITPHTNRRVRLSGIAFGIINAYTNSNIKSWDWSDEASIRVSSIPATVQKISVIADNGQFSILDDDLIACIHPGNRITTSVIVDGERIPMKDTLLRSITDDGDGITATIESVDSIYLLDKLSGSTKSDPEHKMWTNAKAFIEYQIAKTSELYGATKSGLLYSMPSDREAIAFYPNRFNATLREILPTIAQAIRCHIYQGRDGTINFVDTSDADTMPPTVLCDRITKANSTKITSTIDDRVNRLYITTAIVDKDPDDSRFDEEKAAVGIISNKYSGETINQEDVTNFLLSNDIGGDVAKWLIEQYNRRITYKAEWRGNPALDLLDVVTINGNPAIITGLDFSFDGYFRGTITAACGLYNILKYTTFSGSVTNTDL